MKRLPVFVFVFAIAFLICCAATADRDTVDLYSSLKDHEIEKYYIDLGKWFAMMSKLKEKESVANPDQSSFKTMNRLLLDDLRNVVQYSADASAEFWAMVFDADNLKSDDPNFQKYSDILDEISEMLDGYQSSIAAVGEYFSGQYESMFEDRRISKSEYQSFLAGILSLNNIMQEVLKIESAQDTPEALVR